MPEETQRTEHPIPEIPERKSKKISSEWRERGRPDLIYDRVRDGVRNVIPDIVEPE